MKWHSYVNVVFLTAKQGGKHKLVSIVVKSVFGNAIFAIFAHFRLFFHTPCIEKKIVSCFSEFCTLCVPLSLKDGQSRTVRQFQFTDWPEQGVPKSGEGFIDFIGQVHKTKEQFGQDGPISVHCR